MGDLFAPSHLLLILLFALLFFGPSKLPELGRAFGKTIKSFREGAREVMQDEENANRTEPVVVDASRDARRLD